MSVIRPIPRSVPRRWTGGAAVALLAAVAVSLSAAAAAPTTPLAPHVPSEEVLRYDWRLGGFVGFVAGFFLPNRGVAVMSVRPADGGGDGSAADDGNADAEGDGPQLVTELLITSPAAAEGDHWRYGSRIEADSGQALEAWSSYKWREKANAEGEVIEQPAVLDIVSAIYAIRRHLPQRPTPLRVWSDGKIYPVEVVPRGFEQRKIAGRRLTTLHYTVRGDAEAVAAGGRPWKGKLELWLARDAVATPVQIYIERSFANLRLELAAPPTGG